MTRWRDHLIIALLVVYAAPFVWQVATSLRPDAELIGAARFSGRLTLAHYAHVLGERLLTRALVNSAVTALATTLIALAIGAGAAYAIARLPFPGRRAFMLAVVMGTAFPAIATVAPLYLIVRALGLRDTWAAVVLAHTSFALPLTVWLLAGFIRELPVAMEEAALVDGATRLQALARVVFPAVAPGAAAAAILVFLASWNEFLFAYTFTATESSRTAPVALALFPGLFEVPWGDVAAAAIVTSLPPIAIVVALQRWLVRGLTAGSVKD